jgi:hypothetical protein
MFSLEEENQYVSSLESSNPVSSEDHLSHKPAPLHRIRGIQISGEKARPAQITIGKLLFSD